MSDYTKGELHRHGLEIDIRKADGDHTRLANMNESSTAYLPVYEVQAANADHLVLCWNSHDALLEACKELPEPKDILAEASYTGGDVPKSWIRDRGNYIDGYNQALKDVTKLHEQAIALAEKEVGQ